MLTLYTYIIIYTQLYTYFKDMMNLPGIFTDLSPVAGCVPQSLPWCGSSCGHHRSADPQRFANLRSGMICLAVRRCLSTYLSIYLSIYLIYSN